MSVFSADHLSVMSGVQVTKQEEKLTQKEDELRVVVEKLNEQTKECQENDRKLKQVSRLHSAHFCTFCFCIFQQADLW